jgi:hypothetical protein
VTWRVYPLHSGFGLKNASITFQRKVDKVRNKLEYFIAYQGDLELASKDAIQIRKLDMNLLVT